MKRTARFSRRGDINAVFDRFTTDRPDCTHTLTGKTVETIHAVNAGEARLPWLKYENTMDPVQTRTVKFTPSDTPRNWKLLLWGAGDMSVNFVGIPSAVSTAPAVCPAGK